MLKHERYCGKWKGEGCCAGQRKCDGFQGAHLLFAAHCGKWTPPQWRKAAHAMHPGYCTLFRERQGGLWSVSSCLAAERQRGPRGAGIWDRTQVKCKVRGWVNPAGSKPVLGWDLVMPKLCLGWGEAVPCAAVTFPGWDQLQGHISACLSALAC